MKVTLSHSQAEALSGILRKQVAKGSAPAVELLAILDHAYMVELQRQEMLHAEAMAQNPHE